MDIDLAKMFYERITRGKEKTKLIFLAWEI
jgi:hypothetical protein